MRRVTSVILPALLIAGCGEEQPTAVGTELLPAGLVRTYEVILDASEFLVLDTAFAGYRVPFDAPFLVVASSFQGALHAHALARMKTQDVIMVANEQGLIVPDSTPRYIDGELLVRFDTLRSNVPGPVTIRASRIGEPWHVPSVSWDLRVDTTDAQLAWTQPGGTIDGIAGEAEWDLEGDSLLIPIDSATIAMWNDTTDLIQGVLLEAVTPETRLRIIDLALTYRAGSDIDPDTTVELTYRPGFPTFIFSPEPGDVSEAPRIGGLPAWRTMFRLVDRLDNVRVPCPPGALPGCRIPLRDLTVNAAELLLEPIPPPAGFAPEDSMAIGVIPMYVTADVPLSRSPLAGGAPGSTGRLSPERLVDTEAGPIRIPTTGVIALFAADSALIGRSIPPYIALIAQTEGLQHGFAAFADEPSLRLIVTFSSRLDIR